MTGFESLLQSLGRNYYLLVMLAIGVVLTVIGRRWARQEQADRAKQEAAARAREDLLQPGPDVPLPSIEVEAHPVDVPENPSQRMLH